MDGAVTCIATAGEVVPVKGVPKVPTVGPKVKYDGVEEEPEAPLLNIKEEKAVVDLGEQDQEKAVVDLGELDDNKKVSGWNTNSGTTVREDQKVSQDKKAELNAAKKGLGFFCYGSHGAVKTKF